MTVVWFMRTQVSPVKMNGKLMLGLGVFVADLQHRWWYGDVKIPSTLVVASSDYD